MGHQPTRRSFLKTSATAAATSVAALSGWGSPCQVLANGWRSRNEQPVFGFIGLGIRYHSLVRASLLHGPCAALCDVDGAHLREGRAYLDQLYHEKQLSTVTPSMVEDYRRVLDRNDIDAVVIATPDHWHTKIAIEAMQSGKDVYCEKPLTLTIEEGQEIQNVLQETGRVFQVGTQQRTCNQFQVAAAMLREGRVGDVQRVTCAIGHGAVSDSLPTCAPPSELNWNRWLGPAPYTPYRASPTLPTEGYGSQYPHGRCHGHFRWWYEYAGGILTDWGAHHIDIAMWALNKSDDKIGPFTIETLRSASPVDYAEGYPAANDRFNTATEFHLRLTFQDGIELDIIDNAQELGFDNGIMFQGTEGRYFVNRGKLTGQPVEQLKDRPLSNESFQQLGLGDPQEKASHISSSSLPIKQFQNFDDCIKSRATPISDVASHHRHLSICHLANIALRLGGRKLTYDPATERFVGDELANTFLSRESRKGFEITT